MKPPPMEWLYRNTKVMLLKQDPLEMSYMLIIPSFSTTYYKKYTFINFWVPLNNTDFEFMKTIQTKNHIAIDFTGSKTIELNNHCYGNKPITCITPITRTGNSCEADLIMDHPTPNCNVRIIKRPTDKTVDIKLFQMDQIIISPLIKDLTVVTRVVNKCHL